MNKKFKKYLLIPLAIILIVGAGLAYNYYSMDMGIKSLTFDKVGKDDLVSAEEAEEDLNNPFDAVAVEDLSSKDLSREGSNSGKDEIRKENALENEIQDDISGNMLAQVPEKTTDTKIKNWFNKKSADKTQSQMAVEAPVRVEDTSKPEVGEQKPSKRKTYNQVVQSYKPRFDSLETKQEGDLNNLIADGKEEYFAAKRDGKSVIKLGVKYLNKAKALEKAADGEFESLNGQLETELKSNSHGTGIAKQLKKYYNQKKKTLRSGLMEKVKGL